MPEDSPLVGYQSAENAAIVANLHGDVVQGGSGRILPPGYVPERGNRPFVGREEIFKDLSRHLDGERSSVVVLRGQPGVGKSETAREYARRNRDRYPGGLRFLAFGGDGTPTDLARLGEFLLPPSVLEGASLSDKAQAALAELGKRSTLLIYDNVDRPEALEAWLPAVGAQVDVIATSVWEIWDDYWHVVQLRPLESEQAHELVEKITGQALASELVRAIVDDAGGLPVQLVPSARTLGRWARRHPGELPPLKLTHETQESFDRYWSLLSKESRELLSVVQLFNPDRLPEGSIRDLLRKHCDWPDQKISMALEECFDLGLLESEPLLRMH